MKVVTLKNSSLDLLMKDVRFITDQLDVSDYDLKLDGTSEAGMWKMDIEINEDCFIYEIIPTHEN